MMKAPKLEHKMKMIQRLSEVVKDKTPEELEAYADRFLGTPEQMEIIDQEKGEKADIGDVDEDGKPLLKPKKKKYDFI